MNRMDRLFQTVLLLQRKAVTRAEDLARRFGISKRTVYRDINTLNEAGVPVVTLPGEGYQMMEGFFLPPLNFSEGEAAALVLAARMFATHAESRLSEQAERALEKISAVLPDRTRRTVEPLVDIIQFYRPPRRFNLDDDQLVALQQAIRERRVVHLRYHSYGVDDSTERDVEPYSLMYNDGAWYLTAFCRLRVEQRSFRVNRIESLSVRDEIFEPRFMVEPEHHPLEVRVRFDARVVRSVRERQHYGFRREEPLPGDGNLIMVYEVDSFSELQPWLLGWGAAAEVLDPEYCREEIRQEVIRLAEKLT